MKFQSAKNPPRVRPWHFLVRNTGVEITFRASGRRRELVLGMLNNPRDFLAPIYGEERRKYQASWRFITMLIDVESTGKLCASFTKRRMSNRFFQDEMMMRCLGIQVSFTARQSPSRPWCLILADPRRSPRSSKCDKYYRDVLVCGVGVC